MRDDAGVSPVIGTILMVAITVVIAAVVFVIASGFGEKTEGAPSVSFRKDATEREVMVIRVEVDTQWGRDLAIGGTCAATATLNGAPWPPPSGSVVQAGDVLGGCQAGDSLEVIATKPNVLVFQTVFD